MNMFMMKNLTVIFVQIYKYQNTQLRQMEADGLLTRKVYPEVPPRVEYTLTDLGYSLKPILNSLEKWGNGYKDSLR